MSRRLVLGPEPAFDPFKDRPQQETEATTSAEIRWDSRKVGRPLSLVALVSMMIVAAGIWYPDALLAGTATMLICVIVVTQTMQSSGSGESAKGQWEIVLAGDVGFSFVEGQLQVRDVGGQKLAAAMRLDSAGADLVGDLGALVRAVDDSMGLFVSVSMKPEKIESVLQKNRFSHSLSLFLDNLSRDGVTAYAARRGGMWSAGVLAVGYGKRPEDLSGFESAMRAAIPEREWHRVSPNGLCSRFRNVEIDHSPTSFYATGSELSEWLVQLPSELAPEVGANVPAEFVSPIRSDEADYALGVSINPETLRLGPSVGLSDSDLERGLLICGGGQSERRQLLMVLIDRLLHSGKHVLIATSDHGALGIPALSEQGVSLELGRNLVLNPVDSDGVARSEYVPQLLTALEVLCGADLRGAVDLEIALNKVVALGNATVADVHLGDSSGVQGTPESSTPAVEGLSRASLIGMNAIRMLHQGSGARAFYGTQTVPLQVLTEAPLSVLLLSLGSPPLDRYAWDLLCLKLTGLDHDKNLVVILDGPDNLRVRNRQYGNRDVWTETLLRALKRRGPIIVGLDHPADMSSGALGVLSCCVSLKLREGIDLKVAVDLLGLSVIATGIHSKARQSSRETSFLRVMEPRMALMVRGGSETCIPVKIDVPQSDIHPPTDDEMVRRLAQVLRTDMAESPHRPESLLDRVAGGERDLAVRVLRLLMRYEPLTEEAVKRFIVSSGGSASDDVQGVIARLERASLILRGHEVHGGVSYTNYRITMKGTMLLRETETKEGSRDIGSV